MTKGLQSAAQAEANSATRGRQTAAQAVKAARDEKRAAFEAADAPLRANNPAYTKLSSAKMGASVYLRDPRGALYEVTNTPPGSTFGHDNAHWLTYTLRRLDQPQAEALRDSTFMSRRSAAADAFRGWTPATPAQVRKAEGQMESAAQAGERARRAAHPAYATLAEGGSLATYSPKTGEPVTITGLPNHPSTKAGMLTLHTVTKNGVEETYAWPRDRVARGSDLWQRLAEAKAPKAPKPAQAPKTATTKAPRAPRASKATAAQNKAAKAIYKTLTGAVNTRALGRALKTSAYRTAESRVQRLVSEFEHAVRLGTVQFDTDRAAYALSHAVVTGRANSDVSRYIKSATAAQLLQLVADVQAHVIEPRNGDMTHVGRYLNFAYRYDPTTGERLPAKPGWEQPGN